MSQHEHFRAAKPPYAARDPRATNAIVLVVGEWLDNHGRVIAVQVVATTQRRRVLDVAPIPPLPDFPPLRTHAMAEAEQ